MSYRDDREALHHRVAQLEQQLEDARREGEAKGRGDADARAASLEGKLAAMRSEVEAMGAELGALRGKTPRHSPPAALLLGVAGVIVALGAGLFVAARPRPASRWPAAPTFVLPSALPPVPFAPAPPEAHPSESLADPALASARSTRARWNARVTRADGLALAAGATCTIDATISTKDTNAGVDDLAIQCGTEVLYRSSDPYNGMSETSNDAREVLGPGDDKSTFTLAYSDIGTRSGKRAQVDLDTTHHQALVHRDTIPRFRVDLAMAAESTTGAPLSGPEQRLVRAGKVTRVTGAAPVKTGTSCILRAMPTGQDKACTAEVRCGGVVLFPSTTPLVCAYDGTRPASFTSDAPEQGGALTLDGSTLVVVRKTFGADLALDEP